MSKAQLGSLQFDVSRIQIGTLQKQSLETGQGYHKSRLLDFSGGLDPRPGIRPAEHNVDGFGTILENTYRWNPGGYQTRLPGLCILPDVQTNQASITTEEDLSTAEADNWFVGSFTTPLGGSAELMFMWVGHTLYSRTTAGAMRVVHTFTNVITCVAKLVVDGSEAIAVAVRGSSTAADSKIFYTTDPTGATPSFTALVDLSDGDYVTGMLYVASEGPGYNVIVGQVATVNGCWWIDTVTAATWTLEPLVLDATKDQINTSNVTQNTGAIAPWFALGVDPHGNTDTLVDWADPTNVEVDDGSYATVALTATTPSDFLLALFDFRSHLPPDGVEIVGLEYSYQRKSSGTTTYTSYLSLFTDLAPDAVDGAITTAFNWSWTNVGINKALGTADAWATADEIKTAGGATDLWASPVTLADLITPHFGVALEASASATRTASIDYVTLKVYYRRTGSSVGFTLGGWQETPDLLRPNVMTIFTPSADEITARTKPRHGWEIETVWNSAQERPVISAINAVQDGGLSVRHSYPYKMGHVLVAGNDSGPGTELLLTTGGNLYNLDWFGYDGQYITKINSVFALNDYLVLDLVMYDTDGTTVKDRQFCYWNNGHFHNGFMRQSNTDGLAISKAPLPCSSVAMNIADELYYSLFPNSTHTAIVRVRLPSDPAQDPRLVGASTVKSMGWSSGTENVTTYIYSQQLEIAESQDANAVISALRQIGSNNITTATGTSGSVKVDMVVDDDLTFASADVSKEFTSIHQRYQVVSGGKAGRTFAYRLGLTHSAGTAKTPDGLGFVSSFVEQYPMEETLTLLCDPESLIAGGVQSVTGGPLDVFSFMDAVSLQAAATPVVKLTLGNYKESASNLGIPVEFLGFGSVNLGAPERGEPFTESDLESEPNRSGQTTKTFVPLLLRRVKEATMAAS